MAKKKGKNKTGSTKTCNECYKEVPIPNVTKCDICNIHVCSDCASGRHLKSASHCQRMRKTTGTSEATLCSQCPTAISLKPEETVHYVCEQCEVRIEFKGKDCRKLKAARPRCWLCKFDLCKACASPAGPHLESDFHRYIAIRGNVCCRSSNQTFLSRSEKKRHYLEHHKLDTQYRCCDCDIDFRSDCALERHLNNKTHDERNPTFWCDRCELEFPTDHLLERHISKHKNLRCIGGSNCTKKFVKFHDMVQHLESGRCRSGLNRDKIHELLLKHDSANTFTIPAVTQSLPEAPETPKTNSITTDTSLLPSPEVLETHAVIEELDPHPGSDTDSVGGGVTILTPTTTTPPSTRRESFSTPTGILTPTTGPTCYELDFDFTVSNRCPLCPERKFVSATALQMHLLSPAHAPKIYRCPTFLFDIPGQENEKKPAKKEFKTLGGLLTHLQSGRCAGGQEMLENALKFVEGKLKAGGVRLLSEVS